MMTGGFYPGVRARTRLSRQLLREDDLHAGAVAEGVIAGQAVPAGDKVHVTHERVSGLPERYCAADEEPRARHIGVEVTAACGAAGHEQTSGGRAVRTEAECKRRAGRDPIDRSGAV